MGDPRRTEGGIEGSIRLVPNEREGIGAGLGNASPDRDKLAVGLQQQRLGGTTLADEGSHDAALAEAHIQRAVGHVAGEGEVPAIFSCRDDLPVGLHKERVGLGKGSHLRPDHPVRSEACVDRTVCVVTGEGEVHPAIVVRADASG